MINLNDFFNPVGLDRPDDYYEPEASSFGRNLTIHTPDHPIPEDICEFKIALIGVQEDRYSRNRGCAMAPDRIRNKLYHLTSHAKAGFKIIDLGNLKIGDSPGDTYYGIQGVLIELMSHNVISILMGGSQDISYGAFLAYKHMAQKTNMVSVDSRIDLMPENEDCTSYTYLNNIVYDKNTLFSFTNLGHQSHYVAEQKLNLLNKLFHQAYRLGEIVFRMHEYEPVMRDADIISIDIGAIRQSDAPGNKNPSPNGFSGFQACQLSKYAGMSDKAAVFCLTEVNPLIDLNNHTSHQAAQMIWYFIDGLVNRLVEIPSGENSSIIKFIVTHEKLNHDLLFYKSTLTNRWWIEVPALAENTMYTPHIIACSAEDYELACKSEIPDRWWKTFQKIN